MSKVDQKGVFLKRLFGAVVSIVTTMVTYQNVCAREDDRVQTLIGIGTQRGSRKKNVENVSVSSFQIVAFEEAMDDGDDVEDHFGPPEKIGRFSGRQTRSSFGRTEANLCLFCQTKKRDRRDRRRFENLVRCEGDSTPATLVSAADVRGDERILLEIRYQDLWAKDVLYHRSYYQSYTSPSTLKRLVEKELDEEAAEVSENARKKAFASLCAFITESILHTKNVTDISQLCIKYVKFLNDEGVEKVRLEKGLMAISDILLGGCLEAFIPENFCEILQIGEEEN